MLEVSKSIRKTLSFCLITVDSFRGTVYRGPVKIYADGRPASFIKKEAGVYAFINQPEVNLAVEAYGFEKYEAHVSIKELTPNNPIVTVKLRPGKEYSYPSTANGAKFKLVNKKGEPLANIPVNFYVDSAAGFEAVLTSAASRGDRNISVMDIYGGLADHSTYKILSVESDEKDEYISVKDVCGENVLNLEHQLKQSHAVNDKLVYSHMTETDAFGSVLVAFNNLHKPEVDVIAEIMKGKTVKEVRLRLAEGLITDLGSIEV